MALVGHREIKWTGVLVAAFSLVAWARVDAVPPPILPSLWASDRRSSGAEWLGTLAVATLLIR
eukprot:7870215-Prorocentrum_lima.AAC.1